MQHTLLTTEELAARIKYSPYHIRNHLVDNVLIEGVHYNPLYHALKARMDLWCALWFWPGEQIELAPLPREFANPNEQALAIAAEVARRLHFFHWELEFPDVFTATQDGFDALLGNPPWEIQKPNSKEFFSNHDRRELASAWRTLASRLALSSGVSCATSEGIPSLPVPIGLSCP